MKYSVIKSARNKYVYFKTPRVATRSTATLLKEHTTPDIGPELPWNKMYADWRILFPDIPYDSTWDDYFKFTFVRNPWDRLASCYRGKILPHISDDTPNKWEGYNMIPSYGTSNYKIRNSVEAYKSFHTFVEDIALQEPTLVNKHYRRQLYLFPNDKMDYIGRFEDFEDNIFDIFRSFGVEDINIPHVTEPKPSISYADLYTDETAGMVYDMYRDDIETFGYKFGY